MNSGACVQRRSAPRGDLLPQMASERRRESGAAPAFASSTGPREAGSSCLRRLLLLGDRARECSGQDVCLSLLTFHPGTVKRNLESFPLPVRGFWILYECT